MRKACLLLISLLLLLSAPVSAAEEAVPSPGWAAAIGRALGVEQLAVVSALGGPQALFSLHERDAAGNWHVVVSTHAFIGENGLGKTRTGDKKTPRGVFPLNTAFGIEDDPGSVLPYHKVTEYDYWSGDYYHYNQMVDIRDYPALDPRACEHLIDIEPQYRYCLNIGYNAEGDTGAGAAIFLHCMKPGKEYTAGCVAIPEQDMIAVLRHVGENSRIVIEEMDLLLSAERLPAGS